jgi:hypothetical protein
VKIDRFFGGAACVIVATGLVLAFLVIGPPGHARLIALDRQRVSDLDGTASKMHNLFGEANRLPKNLPADLKKRDPVTGLRYEFQRIDARHYALCAPFALPAESESGDNSWRPNWPHGAGLTCYEFDVSAWPVAPRLVPAVRSRTK